MNAQNKVIKGDFANSKIVAEKDQLIIMEGFNRHPINDATVESYDVLSGEQHKSVASGVARAAVGVAVFGTVGLLAGASAKNKGIYQVAVNFKGGKRSLIEIDEKLYKILVSACF